MRALDPEAGLADRISEICADHAHLEGPLLPILHAVQDELGSLSEAVIAPIAEALNISRAEVHGVISFYHDFRTEPAGRHILKICRAEACQAMGATALAETAKARLGVDWHGTTGNGAVTLEPVYCLGLCACGPAAMVDDRVVGRVDAGRLEDLLVEAGA
ncbi:formate dehydrogenase subunit gamma [Ponticoccus sp. SC2-23]|uniref:formate dehydrogenase subunit gamma n=1 Tax=Alexandriicola marinus TaxID=2081710 RepID=UPI000FD912E5|nr:formate dehydrogenase subunit gamma [Alexandriicola marinus]MBM1221497.1 formate dehydrogenase subunit gamma [Ponticoccus sp. SC6-9]MBM1226538.1 formate dehydrogenase subunit gamma [Ponticoccus sp. SC6-15]MBM1230489.1 formate dehydrogenase subunit gamma [Ponticoccus sp. SC6-38]MBM1235012.1 formate dehydrogenase subunit gamma [Ponticoccus sp. SC6-45]MBM1239510.1 formate dehydrogenase subunit gamma [Ponticoccus sp. SC6-49]MBM1243292.1 formate dehydrogenase subunit gamma [Ponticoccus sp. SC2-